MPSLKECFSELVTGWDDALDRGELSGDDAMPWREQQLTEARKVIDDAVEHLRAVAEAANAGQWLPDDVDTLGVQTDFPMLIDTLHDLWANWATMRIECSKEPIVPLSWPRLTEPVEESDDDEGDDGRPQRKSFAKNDDREDSLSDGAEKSKKNKAARKVMKDAAKAESSLRILAARLDKKARKSRSKRRSGSADSSSSSDSNRRHSKGKKSDKKGRKKKKSKKSSAKKSQQSKKSRRGHRGSPSDSSGSDISGSSDTSSKTSSRSRSRSLSVSSDEGRRLRRLRRAVRDIQRQQAVATVNVAEVVKRGSREKLQLRAKPFSWSGQTGKQGNVLIQYASMIYTPATSAQSIMARISFASTARRV